MFRHRSFFLSLFLGNLFLIALILGVGYFLTSREVRFQTMQLTDRFQEQLLQLAAKDITRCWPNSEERIRQYCDIYSWEPDFRMTVLLADGRVLGDSEYPFEKMESHLTDDRTEITTALAGQRGESVRFSKTKHMSYRYIAEPILLEGKTVAVVRVAFPNDAFQENRRQILSRIFACFVLMSLAAILLSVFLSWLWYRPIRLIKDSAERIAEGNLDPTPLVDGPLELNRLFRAIDKMRKTVSSQLATITRQREGLQVILAHLPDAIFAMNSSDKIVYFNEAAGNLFHLEPLTELPHLQGVLRNAAVLDFYANQRENRLRNAQLHSIERREIDIFNEKHFMELEYVEVDPETENDVARLLILSDLTEAVRTTKMKADFVANASHELKTPLAAIRAALDNVDDDVYENRETLETIFGIVGRHVARLNALIEDLLSLHSVEDQSATLHWEQTNAAEQKLWIEELFRGKMEEKRLAFSVESDNETTPFSLDKQRLGLILQNLVDNAVKFTPEGGTITLRFEQEGEILRIVCRDTGCGIAKDEQQRVFERFYQVKSSKTGDSRVRGTGLGLAIVKHAVERLHGNVVLTSVPGQGCTFVVTIPIGYG